MAWKCKRCILYVFLFAGKVKYLTMTDTNKVWMPDTFFQVINLTFYNYAKRLICNECIQLQNEKLGHFHNIIVPNVYIRIFPTGQVLYSIRYITVIRNTFV